jgi:hypothetical protein
MTVKKLRERLEEMEKDGHGEETVIIRTMGGLSCTAIPVKDVSHGFDWHHGMIVLHPASCLWVYDKANSRPRKTKGE